MEPRKLVRQSRVEKLMSLRLQVESSSATVWGRSKRRIAIALAALLCSDDRLVIRNTLCPNSHRESNSVPGTAHRIRWRNCRRVPDSLLSRSRLPLYRRYRERRYVRHPGESAERSENT